MKKTILFLVFGLAQMTAGAQAPAISYTTAQSYTIGMAIAPLTPANTGGAVAPYGLVTTFAGSGAVGAADGTGSAASFSGPRDLVIDASGNLYVSDLSNSKIRKITPAGVVTTFAGSGSVGSADGVGTAASFSGPWGLGIDASNYIYVADKDANKIRKISPEGTVTTIAGSGVLGDTNGPAATAKFGSPYDVVVDKSGNVFVADFLALKIKKISGGVVSTFAGTGSVGAVDGAANTATFNAPVSLAIDALGNLYESDNSNERIRKITPAGVVSTFAQNLNFPNGLAFDPSGNLYLAEPSACRIKKITPSAEATILAGSTSVSGSSDGLGSAAKFAYPYGVAVDAFGTVYVADTSNNKIRKIYATVYNISPSLPIGMNFNQETGVISGAPTYISATTTYTISAINTAGVGTTTITITVKPLPPTAPASQKFCGVVPTVANLSASGFALQWYAASAGGTALAANTVLSSGTYYVSQTINGSESDRTPVAVTVSSLPSAPNITGPASFCPGNNITLTSSAGNSYLWSNGATTQSISVATEGSYTVQVTNASGCQSATSAVAAITAIPLASIASQPTDATICNSVGAIASIGIVATGTVTGYVWQYRVVSSANPNPSWITITSSNAAVYSNYTTATLTITRTAALPATGTVYRVLVASACNNVISDTAVIKILSATKAGAVAASASSVCLGGDVTFTATGYVGTGIQWQSAPTASGTFTDIAGATGSSYVLTNAQLSSNKSYRVQVTNSCNATSAFSAAKSITIDPVSVGGTITGGGVVCSGSNGTLKVVGCVGKIQWQYSTDNVNYVNAPKAADAQTTPFGTSSVTSTAASYMITGISSELYFRAKITSGDCSSAYTASAHYVIGTAAVAGTATAGDSTVCPAASTVLALSNATGAITWEKSTNYTLTSPTWTSIANSNTLSISSGNLPYSTAYRASVTIGGCSTATSNMVYVAVVAKPLAKAISANVTSPTGKTAATALCNTSNAKILTVGAGTVGNIQWQQSGTSATTGFTDIAGATSTSYTVTNPLAIGANYYRVRVTNSCGAEVFGTAVVVYFKNCELARDLAKAPVAFNAVAYPNPYTENFHLGLTSSGADNVTISIYDMTGKQMEKYIIPPGEVPGLQVGNGYPSGVYNVLVMQGNDLKTLRVIKR